MSSKSFEEPEEEFLDKWLTEQNFPTDVPRLMKKLAFAGHLSLAGYEISLEQGKTKKPRGRPRKLISDYVKRADIFRSTEQMLSEKGHENLTQTEVINVCTQIAKILHKHGLISAEELSLWTKVSSEKSILDHLPEGFAKLDKLSRK